VPERAASSTAAIRSAKLCVYVHHRGSIIISCLHSRPTGLDSVERRRDGDDKFAHLTGAFLMTDPAPCDLASHLSRNRHARVHCQGAAGDRRAFEKIHRDVAVLRAGQRSGSDAASTASPRGRQSGLHQRRRTEPAVDADSRHNRIEAFATIVEGSGLLAVDLLVPGIDKPLRVGGRGKLSA